MEESVDIVNEEDEVIGKTTKQHAHQRGLLHRCVIAHVRDSKGRWLFVKQAFGRQDSGQFVSPVGGHIRSGEANDESLKREAREELGITDFHFFLLGKAVFKRFVIEREENHYFIIYQIYSDALPVLNHESESYRYFTTKDLKKELKRHPDYFGAAFYFELTTFPNLLNSS